MAFLKNVWYLAAWAAELSPESLLKRTIAGEPLVFFRDAGGSPTVLLDACPHRFAPLSAGLLSSGTLQCRYHGLVFGADGRCLHNPHGAATSAMAARRFTVVEKHGALWVWLGDADRVDASLIPDLGFIDRTAPGCRVQGRLFRRADYRLMVDNILDLSHADYLHPDSLGGGINTRTRAKVVEEENSIAVMWHAYDDLLPPAHRGLLPPPSGDAGHQREGHGDFLNDVTWFPPGVMVQRLRFSPPGEMATRGLDSWTTHTMTPETASTTHYFYCHTSDSVNAQPAIAPVIKGLLEHAFEHEDGPMIEGQSDRIAGHDFWSLRPALLAIDEAPVRARRRLERLIAAEAAQG